MTAAASTNIVTTVMRRTRSGRSPIADGGADEVGFLDVTPGEFVEVEAEPGQQREAEHQVDVAGRRDDEGGHAGDQEEAEFDTVALLEGERPYRLTTGLSPDFSRNVAFGGV
jgi:hypothetical protein